MIHLDADPSESTDGCFVQFVYTLAFFPSICPQAIESLMGGVFDVSFDEFEVESIVSLECDYMYVLRQHNIYNGIVKSTYM